MSAMVGGISMPLDRAVEEYDELPAVGDKLDVAGKMHVVQKRTITQKVNRPGPELTIKLARATEEVTVHAEIDTEEEIREQAAHLLDND